MQKLALALLSVAFFVMGAVVIFSTTSAEVLDLDLDRTPYHSLARQALYGFAGFLLALYLRHLGSKKLLALSPFLFWGAAFLLLVTLVPGIGKEVNGARRWLSLGGLTFQPSEFVKYLLPLYLIHRLSQLERPEEMAFRTFARVAAIVLIPIVLVAVEPNNGTAAVIGMGAVTLFFLVRIPFRFWVAPLVVCVCIGGVFAYNMPYVSARLKVYLNPELDIRGKGHQPYQAKIAAGSGQLIGKGPGKSWQKLSYLPEAQNDYIAAIYAEEYGFVGTALLLFAYMAFAYLGFSIALSAEDLNDFLLAGTFTFLIAFQAFLNLAVVSGILPSTGMNLPFFSQGGTSLMANIGAVAVMLSVRVQSSGEKRVSTV